MKNSSKIEKTLKSFWQKHGFNIKHIKHSYSNSKYFSPVGCLRISISHTGIAEAYMSLFKSLIQYVQLTMKWNAQMSSVTCTFISINIFFTKENRQQKHQPLFQFRQFGVLKIFMKT